MGLQASLPDLFVTGIKKMNCKLKVVCLNQWFLFFVFLFVRGHISSNCESFCNSSPYQCSVRVGCRFSYPDQKLRCVGVQCKLNIHMNFHPFNDQKYNGRKFESKLGLFHPVQNATITDKSLTYNFISSVDNVIDSNFTTFHFVFSFTNVTLFDTGEYNITITDDTVAANVLTQRYDMFTMHSSLDCKSEVLETTNSPSYILLLKCTVQEGYSPISVDILSSSECPLMASTSLNGTLKMVTAYAPPCMQVTFVCVVTWQALGYTSSEQYHYENCSFEDVHLVEKSQEYQGFLRVAKNPIVNFVTLCLTILWSIGAFVYCLSRKCKWAQTFKPVVTTTNTSTTNNIAMKEPYTELDVGVFEGKSDFLDGAIYDDAT